MEFIKLWRLNISNLMNNLNQPVLDRFWTTFYFDLFVTIKRSLIYTLTCCLTYNRLNICLDTTWSGNLCITKKVPFNATQMQKKRKKKKRRNAITLIDACRKSNSFLPTRSFAKGPSRNQWIEIKRDLFDLRETIVD